MAALYYLIFAMYFLLINPFAYNPIIRAYISQQLRLQIQFCSTLVYIQNTCLNNGRNMAILYYLIFAMYLLLINPFSYNPILRAYISRQILLYIEFCSSFVYMQSTCSEGERNMVIQYNLIFVPCLASTTQLYVQTFYNRYYYTFNFAPHSYTCKIPVDRMKET